MAQGLAWREWGRPDAPPLLALHASGCHSGWWRWVAPALATAYRVIAPDLRGHGESAWATAYGFADYIADVLALADSQGLERFALAGHSLGGYVALQLAAEHPERVLQLVVADMKVAATEEERAQLAEAARRPGRTFASMAEGVERYRLMPPEHAVPADRLQQVARENLRPAGDGWVYRFDRAALAHEPLAAPALAERLRVPTLFVRGEHSTIMPRDGAQNLARLARGELLELDGAHHHLILERPAAFADAVLGFLRRQGGHGG